MARNGIVWALRGLVVLGGWALAGVTFWDPRWGLGAAVAAAVFITASALWLAMTDGPLHQCPGQHARPALLRAAVEDHEKRLRNYDGLFSVLGLGHSSPGLHLIQGVQEDDKAERDQRAGLLTG